MVDVNGLKSLVNMSKGYFLVTIINQLLPFLLLPILTRYLTTSDYGTLSLFSFYLVISNSIIGVSISAVISKYFFQKDKSYIAELVGNCIFTSMMLALIVEVLILVTYRWLEVYLVVPLSWMLIIPVGSLCDVILVIGLNICRNTHKVFHFGCHQIGNTLFNVVVSLLLVCVFYWGWYGRALGIISAYVISAIIMLFYLKKNGYLSFSFSPEKQTKIRAVVLPLIPNSVQMNIISQVGLFFMQFYFSKDLVGLYALGFQIAFCVKLLIDTLSMSWSPFLYKQLSDTSSMDKVYIARLLLVLFTIVALGTIAIWLLAKPVLILMTTPAYYGAKQFVPWFTVGMFFYGMYVLLYPILIHYNQQKFIGRTSFVTMIVMILTNIYFAKLFGYMGIVYAYCVTYIFMGLVLVVRSQVVMPLPWIKALKIW